MTVPVNMNFSCETEPMVLLELLLSLGPNSLIISLMDVLWLRMILEDSIQLLFPSSKKIFSSREFAI